MDAEKTKTVDSLLRLGSLTSRKIAEEAGCSTWDVARRKKALRLSRKRVLHATRFADCDWQKAQVLYDEGNTVEQCCVLLGVSYWSWFKAQKLGMVKSDASRVTVPNDRAFSLGSTVSRSILKTRLIKDGSVPYECSLCGQGPVWKDKPLVLILDHKNGVNNDNRRENLRFVCPNCNSQLETFCARNFKVCKGLRDVNYAYKLR